ncbi:MAG: c-type cytochrome [Gemmatimonadota bacterium]|nr:c-type cytochrome [Gemmatimonadota bacterium]MDH5283045.1 c-type cytochrome [Gemmatimonadota bacterium]
MSKESMRDRVLGHADESDGIEEYDNPLPNWWLGLLYFTIIWAVLYGVHYHFVAGRSQPKALAAELAAAEARWPKQAAAAAATTVEITQETVAAGKEIYTANCVSCHGAEMQGGIGPSLVDTTWIHGSAPEQILATISNGVPEKGMLTWGPILGPEKVAQVTAYVVSEYRAATGQQ